MGFTTLSLGLTLTIPTVGTRNWGGVLLSTTWTKISQHQHTGSGDGNPMVEASYSANSISTGKLKANIGYTQFATLLTPAGTTQTIDFNNGVIQKMTLASASGDVTVTLSNPLQGSRYWVHLIQGATPRDVIWPASVKWPQGQKPILSSAVGQVDIVQLYYDGTNFFGDWNLNYV